MPRSERSPAARARQAALAQWLAKGGIHSCVLEDWEGARCASVRWLTGHPMDAVLFVLASGRTVLVPWDTTMAAERADVDQVIPWADFKRSFKDAVAAILKDNGAVPGCRVEFQGRTSHLRWKELQEALPGMDVVLRADGFEAFVGKSRLVKDAAEVAALEHAAAITNEVVERIAAKLRAPGGADGLRELDLAQMVERDALALGAEGVGFETIAAGPRRSWAIHASPAYSAEPFASEGLSILDFGVKVDGYTTDVTLTVARGTLGAEQETMVGLVERAYAAAIAACRPGASPQDPARAADAVFAPSGWTMPHGLGHGIGLDVHEGPGLRATGDGSEPALAPGMVFTIEPGLYHPDHGGVRWENDVLVTETGARVLTTSRILRIR